MNFQENLNQLISILKENKKTGKAATLFLGESCSAKAGMPSTNELVGLIKDKYPKAYKKAETKDLKGCVEQLTQLENETLLEDFEKNAKLNWANLYAAQMISKDYFKQVMTTSIDSLLVRACSLFNEFPSIYDCAAGTLIKPDWVSSKAIYYLRGQTLGAGQGSWESLFNKASSKGPWVVVGFYPEEDDLILKHLIRGSEDIDQGLFWVHSDTSPLSNSMEEKINFISKDAKIIYADPDKFFTSLAQELALPVPEFITNPFSFLGEVIQSVATYPSNYENEEIPVTDIALTQIEETVQNYEGQQKAKNLNFEKVSFDSKNQDLVEAIKNARFGFMAGEPERILNQRKQYDITPTPQLSSLLTWAYLTVGESHLNNAIETSIDKMIPLLEKAETNFNLALEINSNNYEIYSKLGKVYFKKMEHGSSEEKEKFLKLAEQNFNKVLSLKPEQEDAKMHLGLIYVEKANLVEDQNASLYGDAVENLQSALKQNPDDAEAAFGCGIALFSMAKRKKGSEALRFYGQAAEKFQLVLKKQPNRMEALIPMGQSLLKFSRVKKGEEADRMLSIAAEKFQWATKLNPNTPEAYLGWADALLERSMLRNDNVSKELFGLARKKFEKVIELKPGNHRVHYRWGNGLFNMALRRKGDAESKLLNQAADQFKTALKTNPKNYDAQIRLGNVYFQLGKTKSGIEAEALLGSAEHYFKEAVKSEKANHEALTYLGNVYFQQAQNKEKEEATPLLEAVIEKCKSALKVNSDHLNAMTLWGNAIYKMAQFSNNEEKESLIQQAEEKYKTVIKSQPNDPLALTYWGEILLNKSKKESGKKADTLLNQALEYFQSALDIRDDIPEALKFMAEALMEQAETKRGINAHPLLAEAKGKLQQAEELQPGIASFNLAKLMAQLGNESSCREWLKKCKDQGTLPPTSQLKKEEKFASMRGSNWFKKITGELSLDPSTPKFSEKNPILSPRSKKDQSKKSKSENPTAPMPPS